MKSAHAWLKSFPIIFLACLSACKSVPLLEWCLVGEQGLICYDPRKPDGDQNYVIPFHEAKNYIATNPKDFQTFINYCERRSE